ncbi:MAG: ATP-dependent Clp protease adaptor ClpS [Bacteroidetes bacterium]|nr:ATP-dependent Clp protease adaptor ClpS [Bacteroidota bacterium]
MELTEQLVETELGVSIDELIKPTKKLVIYNDEVNTFDHVIESLMDVCKHEQTQAVQCTYLIHFKGNCVVKNGEYKKLKPMYEALQERKLTVKIEE